MKKYLLGIDTSAYTTSIAVVDNCGKVLYNFKKILEVPKGQQGLRQQNAVFMHLNNLPELINEIDIDFNEIGIISVSVSPRNSENSYMPVFVVGKNIAKILSMSLKTKYVGYSHQENHIACAIKDSYKNYNYRNDILAIHISGGTLEFLISKKVDYGFDVSVVGGSKDITFGQLIDRVGVYMGFDFPCGKHMQDYVDTNNVNILDTDIVMPKVSGNNFLNLSGMENYFKNLIDSKKYKNGEIISILFKYISNCIASVISYIEKEYSFEKIIITGGVSANTYIRNYTNDSLSLKYEVIFPNNALSADNAIGTAILPLIDRWYNED